MPERVTSAETTSRGLTVPSATPGDVKEMGGSERAAELKSEDRRLKKIRGGYI